ncbi:MAG: ATP-binding protein [Myxococcales bacterium]|nr:ATP-binding protein [Myxococcales bacterium]
MSPRGLPWVICDGPTSSLLRVCGAVPFDGEVEACGTEDPSCARQRRMLEVITRLNRQFSSVQPGPEAFDLLLAALLEFTGSQYGFLGHVFQSDEGERYLKTRAITNIAWTDELRAWYRDNAPAGLEFRNLMTLFGKVIREGAILIANDAPAHPSAAGVPAGHPPLDRFLGIPLYVGEHFVGMAGVSNRTEPYDLELVESIAPLTSTVGQLLHAAHEHEIRVETERQLHAAAQAARRATAAKGEFLAMMSHEIRTPMNGVLGMVELMLQDTLTLHQRERAETIQSSGEMLLVVLNDVLDYSKIESGKMTLVRKRVRLARACQESIDLVAAMREQAAIDIVLDVPADLDDRIVGDPARVGQLLSNLLGNALKFTESGAVRVSLSTAAEKGASFVRVSVADTGIGVPADLRPLLFEPFTQADAFSTRRRGGTGLGLAICRRLTDLMGGTIDYEPREEGGSVFWFQLPQDLAAYEALAQEPSTRGSRDTSRAGTWVGRGVRVLVAEDNLINQRVARQMLQRLGLEVVCVGDGAQAIAARQRGRFDLVFMDGQMPNMDGYDASIAIRAWEAEEGLVRVPIVAVTASATDGARQRCEQAGMDDFLSKPITISALERCLKQWLPSAEGERAAEG